MAFFDLRAHFGLPRHHSKRSSVRRIHRMEALESRQLLAADWQNPINHLDVDGRDGPDPVTPLDALLVINELTSRTRSDRDTGALAYLEPGTQPPPYLDVNGNGFLSPLDALLVINALPTSVPPVTDDFGAPDSVLAGTRAALATGVTSDSRVNTETRRWQSFPELAAGGNQLIVTWSSWDQDGSDWGIFGQRYNASGAKIGAEFQVNTTTRHAQRDSRVAVDAQGRFVVLWQSLNQDGGSWGVYARIFNADATPRTGEILVNTGATTGGQLHPDVSFLSTGQLIVTFEGRSGADSDGIHAKVLNLDGTSATSTFLVNSTTQGNQSHPRVAATTDGFAIAWDGRGSGDNTGVFMRAFSNGGAPLTGELLVNTRTQGTAKEPSISFQESEFLVAWQEDSESGWGVRAHRFTAAGVRIGTTITVNQTQRSLQIGPEVAHLREGGFVVTWFGQGAGDGRGIFSRTFLADGTPEHGESLVNSTTDCLQSMPALASFNNGFVVAWQGNGEGDRHGIYARFFETDPLIAPQLVEIPDQAVDEQTPLRLTATATDSDTPTEQLRYSLDAGPVGAVIDPITGEFSWSPTEADGPGSFNVIVRVRENDDSSFFDTEAFSITVREVNQAPVLEPIQDQTVNEGVQLSIQAVASDPDLPANELTFSLDEAPASATINATTGLFQWTPPETAGGNAFVVRYRVTDNGSPVLSTVRSFTINVTEVNSAPTLAPIADQTIDELSLLSVTPSGSDADGDPLDYSLVSAPEGATINASTGEITWTPTEVQGPGSFTFEVRVTELGSEDLFASQEFSVDVLEVNIAPQISAIADQNASEFELFSFDVVATDNDLPANSLTYSLEAAPAGATISANGRIEWTPPEDAGGTDATFTVRVTDNGSPSLFAEETFVVAVLETNAPPEITAIADTTIDEFEPLELDIAATDSDLPAQTLVFSLDQAPIGAMITPTGRFSFTPDEQQGGASFTVVVRVTDSGSPSQFDTEEFTISVNEVNTAPSVTRIELLRDTGLSNTDKITSDPTVVADLMDDTGLASIDLVVDGSSPLDIFPLVGNVNLNGNLTITLAMIEQALGAPLVPGLHTLTILPRDNFGLAAAAATPLIFTYIPTNMAPIWAMIPGQNVTTGGLFSLDLSSFASDPDTGDLLRFAAEDIVTLDLPEWLSLDPFTGVLSGMPGDGDVGVINLEVVVTDHDGASATETFDLTVISANDPPQVAPIPDQQVAIDAPFTLDLDSFFTDPNAGTTLTYVVNQISGQALPSFLSLDIGTNVLSGTPAATDAGRIGIRVRGSDPQGLFVEDIFLLDIGDGNKPPLIVPVATQVADVDELFSLGVLPNILEADAGDTVTLTMTLSTGEPLPSWLNFDPVTGILSGTPSAADLGTFLLLLTAQDAAGDSAQTLIELSVQEVNDPPISSFFIADQLATEDSPFLLDLTGVFIDSDAGDSLMLAVTLADGNPLPAWLAFESTTNQLSGTPSATDLGEFAIKVIATDEAMDSTSDTFLLTVANSNDPPLLTRMIPNQTIDQGSNFVLGAAAFFQDSDPQDALLFSASLTNGNSLPSWLTIDAATGIFAGTPAQGDVGTLSIRIVVADSDTLSASDEFDLVVNDINLAPTANDISTSIPVTAVNGLLVSTLVPSDPDLTDTFTFAILSGNESGAFALDPATGAITLADATVLATGQSYDLVIRVTDSGTPAKSVEITATIEITASRDLLGIERTWASLVDRALPDLW